MSHTVAHVQKHHRETSGRVRLSAVSLQENPNPTNLVARLAETLPIHGSGGGRPPLRRNPCTGVKKASVDRDVGMTIHGSAASRAWPLVVALQVQNVCPAVDRLWGAQARHGRQVGLKIPPIYCEASKPGASAVDGRRAPAGTSSDWPHSKPAKGQPDLLSSSS